MVSRLFRCLRRGTKSTRKEVDHGANATTLNVDAGVNLTITESDQGGDNTVKTINISGAQEKRQLAANSVPQPQRWMHQERICLFFSDFE